MFWIDANIDERDPEGSSAEANDAPVADPVDDVKDIAEEEFSLRWG